MSRKWSVLLALAVLIILGGGFLFVSRQFKTKKEFFDALAPDALKLESETGIHPRITLTQAAHESGFGTSTLALTFHNLFGIKAGSKWMGPIAHLPTKEEIAGQTIKVADYFRAYPTYLASMRDWATFLVNNYPQAYAAAQAGDIKRFADGLRKGKYGAYATDSQYATKLVRVYDEIGGLVA